jgi:hypothetical protein
MTGPPKPSSLQLSEHIRSPLVGRLRVLENSRRQPSITANGMRPGSASVAALDAVPAGGLAPPARCVGAKATLEIQHDERCGPPRGRARSALHRTGRCSRVAQQAARAISLLGDGTQLSPVPTPVSPNRSANGERLMPKPKPTRPTRADQRAPTYTPNGIRTAQQPGQPTAKAAAALMPLILAGAGMRPKQGKPRGRGR